MKYDDMPVDEKIHRIWENSHRESNKLQTEALAIIAEQLRIQNLLQAYQMGFAVDPQEIEKALGSKRERQR